MVKRSDAGGAKETPDANGIESQPGITEANIEIVEKDTLDKVNKALGALESALAQWDASPDKPDDLEPRFLRYRKLHDALVVWETKMLRSMDRQLDFYLRVDRLREFARICDMYQ
ncbi:hypothetical protein L0Y65_05680 [Candidatus Micrarchaeota archaeon]|nr:hypothetical protein [Candidatus Micrarchaeota archaeon]